MQDKLLFLPVKKKDEDKIPYPHDLKTGETTKKKDRYACTIYFSIIH